MELPSIVNGGLRLDAGGAVIIDDQALALIEQHTLILSGGAGTNEDVCTGLNLDLCHNNGDCTHTSNTGCSNGHCDLDSGGIP